MSEHDRAYQVALAMVSTSLEMSGERMIKAWASQIRTELRQARAEGRRDTELAKVVSEYLAELDNPAPDWAMRQILRQRMRRALTAGPRKAGEEGC